MVNFTEYIFLSCLPNIIKFVYGSQNSRFEYLNWESGQILD